MGHAGWHPRPRPPLGRRGPGGTRSQAIGPARSGLSTKVVALCDALGNLLRFTLLPGQRHDSQGVAPLLDALAADGFVPGALLADRAFDLDDLRDALAVRGIRAVIPPRRNRRNQYPYDRPLYAARHLVENLFAKLKAWRGIATRHDKTDQSFAAALHLVGAVINAR